MRFIKYLAVSAALAVSVNTFGGNRTFDDSNIVLSLGVISDVHIDGAATDAGLKFRSALQQLKETASLKDKDGLDGIVIAGDLIDGAYRKKSLYCQTDYFKEIYESVLDPHKVPLVYTVGNHDVFRQWNANTVSEAKNLRNSLGKDYFLCDTEPVMGTTYECRHCVIGDCHILCVTPISHDVPATYDPIALKWLDARLGNITRENPDRFVLVISHPMIYNTVYGSDLVCGKLAWYTEELKGILAKYPQAVSFGGHLHFPLNDPRSIWQGEFTAMGCGSVRYMALENGGYEYMAGVTIMKDRNEFSQGLLLQFDANGNMRATRMDFYNKASIGEPWTVSHPSKNAGHLKKYSTKLRKAANTAPVLNALEVRRDSTGLWTAYFTSGKDDEFVHHYVITVSRYGKEVCTKKVLADFYKYPQTSGMKGYWVQPLGIFSAGEYETELKAYDSWGAASNGIKFKFKQ